MRRAQAGSPAARADEADLPRPTAPPAASAAISDAAPAPPSGPPAGSAGGGPPAGPSPPGAPGPRPGGIVVAASRVAISCETGQRSARHARRAKTGDRHAGGGKAGSDSGAGAKLRAARDDAIGDAGTEHAEPEQR